MGCQATDAYLLNARCHVHTAYLLQFQQKAFIRIPNLKTEKLRKTTPDLKDLLTSFIWGDDFSVFRVFIFLANRD